MVNPPQQTMEDYCKKTDVGQISLGFQPTNPVTFDVKILVLLGLRDKWFDEQAIKDPREHMARFYETCSMVN